MSTINPESHYPKIRIFYKFRFGYSTQFPDMDYTPDKGFPVYRDLDKFLI